MTHYQIDNLKAELQEKESEIFKLKQRLQQWEKFPSFADMVNEYMESKKTIDKLKRDLSGKDVSIDFFQKRNIELEHRLREALQFSGNNLADHSIEGANVAGRVVTDNVDYTEHPMNDE